MLNLYRRHRSKCTGSHAHGAQSYEGEENRPKWKKCACPIHASGKIGGEFNRHCTDEVEWEAAKLKAKTWEASPSWEVIKNGQNVRVLPGALHQITPEVKPEAPTGYPVAEAVAKFVAEHEKHSRPNTLKKYKYLTGLLLKFAEDKGYVGVNRFGPADIRDFRDSWGVAVHTATKQMSVIKSFFEFCLQSEWIERNPARLVKTPRGTSGSDKRNEQKLPFEDAELDRMLDAATNKYGRRLIKWDRDVHHCRAVNTYADYKYSWKGEDLADFIMVNCHTGLRISDMATFHIDRLRDDNTCHVRTTKNGKHVFHKLPEWLADRIRWRAEQYGPFIFGEHKTDDINVVTDTWRRKLIRLWDLCEGPDFQWSATPTPHRFRHTFARILLQTPGVTVRDVAELLGDTEDMVRKHYAAWVPDRQARLTAVMEKAAARMPKPAYLKREIA